MTSPTPIELTPNDQTVCEELASWLSTQKWTDGPVAYVENQIAWQAKSKELGMKLDLGGKDVNLF